MGSINEPTKKTVDLPIINISEITPAIGKQMLDAATQHGFLYIDTAGTDFTEEIVDGEFELSKKFFATPTSDKQKYRIDETNHGWTGIGNEILDPAHQKKPDFKECFNLGEFIQSKPQQDLPSVFAEHADIHHVFEKACRATCHRILDILALGLQIEETNFFSARHTQPSGTTVRLLHYPSIPAGMDYHPEVDIRAGAHSDYGSMTLLFQRPSQPGLEIRTADNNWGPVAVIPDGYTTSKTLPPILVNIGDLLSYWTNGLLKSTVHRVIFPESGKKGGEDRYSIAYFCHPANDTKLVPVPSKLVEDLQLDEGVEVGYGGGASKTRAITAKDHLVNRLEATYGFRQNKVGSERTTS